MVDIYLDCSNCNTRECMRNVFVKLQYEINEKGKKTNTLLLSHAQNTIMIQLRGFFNNLQR